jgi:hypothetical protein
MTNCEQGFLYEGDEDCQERGGVCIQVNDSGTAIPDRASLNCTSLKEIRIPASAISIGHAAFMGCLSLMKRDIRNTSVASIGVQAFSDCRGSTEILLPTSVAWIGCHAFKGCSSLCSIRLPDSITSIGCYAFT